jgi:hypothetical protein
MVANGNNLAEFYNWVQQRYDAHTTKDGNLSADEIDQYVITNSANNGPKPTWLIMNEISSSLWSDNPGAPSLSPYRTWLMDCVTRLHDHYGYDVVMLAPFQNPGANDASWQALSAEAYVGIECYLSGTEVWNSGSTNAARLAWAQGQYQGSKNSYMNRGVPANRLFVTEHVANNLSTYTDGTGTHATGWGRAGLASAADWDTVLQIRQDAIKAVGFDGFLAYDWGGNGMGVTLAEQLEHEYWYRTRLVLAGQQPQWLSDSALNVNGTTIPLSWNEQLNWLGGVPNASGAIANFYKTNTTTRTVTLDGSKTIGALSFNSGFGYTISAGTGGSLTLNNGASAANVTVPTGSHSIGVPMILSGSATFNIAGVLSLTSGLSSTASGTITRSGAGTLNISGTQSYASSETFAATGGTTNLNSNSGMNFGLSVTGASINVNAAQTIAAININTSGHVISNAAGNMINAASLSINGGQLNLTDDAMVVRSGTLGTPSSGTYNGLTGLVQSGKNGNGASNWNGNGIITSMTAAKGAGPRTTIGIANASDALGFTSGTRTWRGQTVDASAILLMYTYDGDANLDGKINADDYFQIDSSMNKPSTMTSYARGDFNYDGKINGDDYFIIDMNFAGQGASFGDLPPGGVNVVPEPSTALTILGLGVWCNTRKRRATHWGVGFCL